MGVLGDGDSKAHNELLQRRVYGDKQVTKLECVGHIQKRMGSRLRAVKKQMGNTELSDGKTIGGRGRLTEKRIDSLQVCYGEAIRNNTNSIAAMQNTVMANWTQYRGQLMMIQNMKYVHQGVVHGVGIREILQGIQKTSIMTTHCLCLLLKP